MLSMTHSLVRHIHDISVQYLSIFSHHVKLMIECQRRGEGVEDCSLGAATSDTFGLQQFQYNNSRVPQKVKGHLEETDFNGITVN